MINNKKKIKDNTKLVKFDEALELVRSEVDNYPLHHLLFEVIQNI